MKTQREEVVECNGFNVYIFPNQVVDKQTSKHEPNIRGNYIN